MNSEITTIRLNSKIGVQDVCRWNVSESVTVQIHVTNEAEFAPLAEGVALATLEAIRTKVERIEVRCTHDPYKMESFFLSLFGLHLLKYAHSVEYQQGNYKDILLEQYWKKIQGSEYPGWIQTSGKRAFIFVREPDYVIPPCLISGSQEKFPLPSDFLKMLRESAKSFFGDFSASTSNLDGDLANFLYEAMRNSHEHGRADITGASLAGYRGVIFEKIQITSETELAKRYFGLPILHEYLADHLSVKNASNQFLVTTICDFGAGIQHTLPPIEGETVIDRLNRAIFTTASRKPSGGDIERGKGLSKIREAGSHMGALLFVCSADTCGFVDYTKETKYPKINSLYVGGMPKPAKQLGTSISVIWPEQLRTEQLSLEI
jgi:hypothetical protein